MRETYLLYLKLLNRSWLVGAATAVAVAIAAFGPSPSFSSGAMSQYVSQWLPLTTLGVMLVAIFVAQWDERSRTGEIAGALPIGNTAWILGRLAAVLTEIALVAVMQVAAVGLRGVALGGAVLPWGDYLAMALVAFSTLGSAAVIGFGLGLAFRGPTAPVTLVMLLFIGWVLGLRLAAREFGIRFAMIDFAVLPLVNPEMLSADWFPNGRLIALSRLFHLGVAALVTGLALRFWNRLRPAGVNPRAALAVALVGLVAAGAGGAGYAGIRVSRDRAVQAEREALAVQAPSEPAPGARVVRYDLALDLDLPRNRMRARAEMEVAGGDSPASELVFALRPELRVTAASGAELVEQNGQYVRLRLPAPLRPGEQAAVVLEYEGRVLQWRDAAPSAGVLGSHLTPSHLLLAGNYGWYPILGAEPLATCAGGEPRCDIYNLVRTHPRSGFHLTVRGAGNLPLFSNLTEAGAGEFRGDALSVYLLGGRYQAVREAGIEVLAPADLLGLARWMARYYGPTIETLNSLIPQDQTPRFIVAGDNFGYSDSYPSDLPAVMPGTVIRRYLRAITEMSRTWPLEKEKLSVSNSDLLGLWWPAYSTGGGWRVRREMGENNVVQIVSRPGEELGAAHAPAEMALALLMADMLDQVHTGGPGRHLDTPPDHAGVLTERLRQFWYRNPGAALEVLREMHALRMQRPLTVADLDEALERRGEPR